MKAKGYVYFIQCDKWFKIGATENVYSRFNSIRVCNPFEVSLFHTIKTNNMHITEKLFQGMFARVEGHGEWFELSDKNLEYIKAGNYTDRIIKSIGEANKAITIPDLLSIAG
jgi:hypothetical protein